MSAPDPTWGRRALREPDILLRLAALVIGLVLVGIAADLRLAPRGFVVEWEMASDTGHLVQVFPAEGTVYSADHVLDLHTKSDGSRQTHRAEFDGARPARIRIDPGTAPGRVQLFSIRVEGSGRAVVLEGDALANSVRLLNELAIAEGDGPALDLRATGTDPHFDFPSAPPGTDSLVRAGGAAALAGIGLLLIAWFAWHSRNGASAAWRSLAPAPRVILATFAICVFAYALMSGAGLGCGQLACSPRGWAYAVPLFIACLGFLVVGTALLQLTGPGHGRPLSVFMPILAGQVAVLVYVYLRSLVALVIPALPITRAELWVLVAGCGLLLWRRGWRTHFIAGERASLLTRFALLALACLVVADRELPRLVMLSTDPDTHAFFARQIERMGAIYREQGEWGSDAMNYPAGSAGLVYGWASLSFLDVRNALTALPLLLAFLAALAVAEPIARSATSTTRGGIALLAAIGVTVGGLMFPVYQQFSHMEGTGRLLSMGTVALVGLLLAQFIGGKRPDHPATTAFVLALSVFVLTTLNPVNFVPLAIFVLAVAIVHGAWKTPALLLLASLPVGLLLLTMDPYYWSLIQGTSAPTKVILETRLTRLGVHDLVSSWATVLPSGWRPRVEAWTRLMPWHAGPTFAVPLFAFVAVVIAARRAPSAPRWSVMVVLASVGSMLAAALLEPFANDARFYLLPQYFPLAVAQYKAIALTALAALVVTTADRGKRTTARLIVLVLCTAAIVALLVRPLQPMRTEPRQAYCGSMGCATPSDVTVVSELEDMVADGRIPRVDGELPRVLVPNHPVQAGPESWVFPTGGSRYLALADALPVAFYYYQGDPDYTTGNYLSHVCEGLDRGWLARERIRYVFLPAERTDACPAAFGSLAEGDRVILQSGDSMLIELAPGTR